MYYYYYMTSKEVDKYYIDRVNSPKIYMVLPNYVKRGLRRCR